MSAVNQVECATHGHGAAAFLCRHLVESAGLEFHRAGPTAETPQPDAWCRECEKTRRRAGGWDGLDAASAPSIHPVCGQCYDIILASHFCAPTTLLARLRRLFAPASTKRFIAGLLPGEQLLVKAPFATRAGGREWMWVRVSRWQGPRIHGVLDNDPVDVKELKADAHVDVLEDEVLDYLLYHRDGTHEGNETAPLMHAKP